MGDNQEGNQVDEVSVDELAGDEFWRMAARQRGVTYHNLVEESHTYKVPKVREQLQEHLEQYLAEVETFVDASIAGKAMQPGNRQAEIDRILAGQIQYKKDLQFQGK